MEEELIKKCRKNDLHSAAVYLENATADMFTCERRSDYAENQPV